MQPRDTTRLAGRALAGHPPTRLACPPWDPTTMRAGGFIASVEVRRGPVEPGRGAFWVRTPLPLVEGEPVSPLAGAAGLFDMANGMTVRVDPRDVAFPNVDLTAHLFAAPGGEWIGFDTTVSFGPPASGVTNSVVHDIAGRSARWPRSSRFVPSVDAHGPKPMAQHGDFTSGDTRATVRLSP